MRIRATVTRSAVEITIPYRNERHVSAGTSKVSEKLAKFFPTLSGLLMADSFRDDDGLPMLGRFLC